MKITDLLKASSIGLGQSAGSKDEIISRLADLMDKSGNLSDKNQYVEDYKLDNFNDGITVVSLKVDK